MPDIPNREQQALKIIGIPNREDLEAELAQKLGGVLMGQLHSLLGLLGDPPSVTNLPRQFWEMKKEELADALIDHMQKVYIQAAERMLIEVPISIEWGLVNEGAVNWAQSYSTLLAGDINQNIRGEIATHIRNATADFFEEGISIDELTQRLQADPRLKELFTDDVKDRLGRVYGPHRAEMIAVTETTRAAVEGERALVAEIQKQGIRMVEIWETANDDMVCPTCAPRHGKKEGDGWTKNDGPPAHPRCRCGTNHEIVV